MNREQQKHRITLVRRGIVAGSLVGSLGIAGYLGTTAHASTESTGTDDSGPTTTSGSTTPADPGDTYSDRYGDSSSLDQSQLSSGSSAPDATTRGS